MTLSFAAVTDFHFGPRALFGGRLRKLGDLAPALTDRLVERMNNAIRPSLVLSLGDLIEDQSDALDLERYRSCVDRLSRLHAEVRFAAGNHDTARITPSQVADCWRQPGPLYYAFDHGGVRFIIMHTHERRDVDVSVPEEQVEWLARELRSATSRVVVAMHHSCADQDLGGNAWFADAPQLALVRNRAAVRRLIASSGKVILVLNGHLHWNHVDLHDGIPYVTVQSLTENIDDDAPGRPAFAHAIIRLTDRSLLVTVDGEAPIRYEHHGL